MRGSGARPNRIVDPSVSAAAMAKALDDLSEQTCALVRQQHVCRLRGHRPRPAATLNVLGGGMMRIMTPSSLLA